MTTMDTSSDGLKPRRKPLQKRSQQRVDAILLATQELVESDGFDTLTTAKIAERAGVPIGSVYYLFPNKYAIAVCLIEGCMEAVEEIVLQPYDDRPWDTLLRDRIDALAEYWVRECGFSHLWKALRTCPELEIANAEANQRSIAGMLFFIHYALPELDHPHQLRIAESMVYTIDRMLDESVTRPDETSRLEFVEELKRMLTAYIQSYL